MLILEEVRCPCCNRKLMEIRGQAQVKCGKCKSLVIVDTETRKVYIKPEHRN